MTCEKCEKCEKHEELRIFRKCSMFVWWIMCIIGFSFFFYHCYELISEYLKYPVVMNIELTTGSPMLFPAVSICSYSKYKKDNVIKSRYCKKNPSSKMCEKPQVHYDHDDSQFDVLPRFNAAPPPTIMRFCEKKKQKKSPKRQKFNSAKSSKKGISPTPRIPWKLPFPESDFSSSAGRREPSLDDKGPATLISPRTNTNPDLHAPAVPKAKENPSLATPARPKTPLAAPARPRVTRDPNFPTSAKLRTEKNPSLGAPAKPGEVGNSNLAASAELETEDNPNLRAPAKLRETENPSLAAPARPKTPLAAPARPRVTRDPNFAASAKLRTEKNPSLGSPAKPRETENPSLAAPAKPKTHHNPNLAAPARPRVTESSNVAASAELETEDNPNLAAPAKPRVAGGSNLAASAEIGTENSLNFSASAKPKVTGNSNLATSAGLRAESDPNLGDPARLRINGDSTLSAPAKPTIEKKPNSPIRHKRFVNPFQSASEELKPPQFDEENQSFAANDNTSDEDFDEDEDESTEYLVEKYLRDIEQKTTLEERIEMGYSAKDLVARCMFMGQPCSSKNFTLNYDFRYGNCWTFNPLDGEGNPMHTTRNGPQFGLSVDAYSSQDQKIDSLDRINGFRVLVHSPEELNFPEGTGIDANMNYRTSIGVQETVREWLPHPHYPYCENRKSNEFFKNNQEMHGYSIELCHRHCLQKKIWDACGCLDPRLTYNMSKYDGLACNIYDQKEICCLEDQLDNMASGVECDCPVPCLQRIYDSRISSIKWTPLLKDYPDGMNIFNLARIEVYFRTMDRVHEKSQQKYVLVDIFSSLGGEIGLWLGVSFITFHNICESFIISMYDRHFKRKKAELNKTGKP